ncbi:MAG: hypothetical protein ACUVQ8_08570 [Nitrososphaeria archaeon]
MDSGKLLMVLEALFSGFYIAVSRNLFVPMLAYSGYSLQLLSFVTLAAASANVVISYIIFGRPRLVGEGVRSKLLALHAIERFVWAVLPFTLGNPDFMIVVYALAQLITIPVNVLLNVVMFAQYGEEDFIDLTVKRTAASSATSILGMIFTTFVTAEISPPDSYFIAYVTSSLVGLTATVALVPYGMPAKVDFIESKPSEEVEVKKVNTFLLFVFMLVGGNLLGLAWSPFLKDLGAPVYTAVSLSLAGSVGGMIGPYLWKDYRQYLIAIVANVSVSISILFIGWAPAHLLLSLLASMTFMGANLLATSIYSHYVKSLGMIKASTFLIGANAVGLFIASLISSSLAQDPSVAIMFSAGFRALALAIALLAIPETAVVKSSVAYGYSRLLYSSSVMGYTFTVDTSKGIIKLTVEVLALTLLLMLLYFIYRIVGFIIGV